MGNENEDNKSPPDADLPEETQIATIVREMSNEEKINILHEEMRKLISKWRIPLEFLEKETSFSNSYIRSFVWPSRNLNFSNKFTRLTFLAVKKWMQYANYELPRDAEEFFKAQVLIDL